MVEERIAFGNLDLVGTTQPHDDALVVTFRIGGFNVKRVMIDQGSGTEIMYRTYIEDWGSKMTTSLNMILPLVGINGKVVTPTG